MARWLKQVRWTKKGWRRLAIVLSALWIVGFYIAKKEAIDFSSTVGMSTPSTMCSDVYQPGDERLAACEAASPEPWADRFLRQQRGERIEVPFDHYQNAHHDFSVWYWLLGVPAFLIFGVPPMLTVGARVGRWVVDGFKEEGD